MRGIFSHCYKPFAETGGENTNLLIARIKTRGIHHGMTGCARQSGKKAAIQTPFSGWCSVRRLYPQKHG